MPPNPNKDEAVALYLNDPYGFIIILRSDLMNPLHVIQGAAGLLAEMLNDKDLDMDKMKQFTQMILQNSEGLRSVFDEILEYERIRRDKDRANLPD